MVKREFISSSNNAHGAFFDTLSEILHINVAKIDKYLYMKPISMRYQAKVEVGLKPGHSDPEGETTKQALSELNYSVESIGVSKVYHIVFEAKNLSEAKKFVDDMCKRLLANPVKDNYHFEIEEA